jgi:hypothetical protein
MKLELLVIVNKSVTVNFFSDLVHTARHAWEVFAGQNLLELYCCRYSIMFIGNVQFF